MNKIYGKSINQPLIPVFLSNEMSTKKFEIFSQKINMKWATWLIIFKNKNFRTTKNYCPKPVGNIFHLSFNSKVIVKCHEDKNLYKWHSINKNQIEVHNFAMWDVKNHIHNKTVDIFFIKNEQIGGKQLKSASLAVSHLF